MCRACSEIGKVQILAQPSRSLPVVPLDVRKTAASGGTVTSSDQGRPCQGTGTAATPPMFPHPLPP